MKKNRALAVLLVFIVLTLGALSGVRAQINLLGNPSFEVGVPGQAWTNLPPWVPTTPTGGHVLNVPDARHGTNVLQIEAYGSTNRRLDQRFAVAGGTVHEIMKARLPGQRPSRS